MAECIEMFQAAVEFFSRDKAKIDKTQAVLGPLLRWRFGERRMTVLALSTMYVLCRRILALNIYLYPSLP